MSKAYTSVMDIRIKQYSILNLLLLTAIVGAVFWWYAPNSDFSRVKMNGDPVLSLPLESFENVRGEWGLLNISDRPLDRVMERQCLKFAKLDADEQVAVVEGLEDETVWALFEFGSRSAALALNSRDPNRVKAGLIANVMIAGNMDPRDFMKNSSCLLVTARELGMTSRDLQDVVTQLHIEERIAKYIDLKKVEDRSLSRAWGYVEVDIDGIKGLIRSDLGKYQPQSDLLKISMNVASAIEMESEYLIRHLRIGSKRSPTYWLRAAPSASPTVHGGVRIFAKVDPKVAKSQTFQVDVYELKDAKSAQDLESLLDQEAEIGKAVLAVSKGNILCVVGTKCYAKDGVAHETTESLKRFEMWIEEALTK